MDPLLPNNPCNPFPHSLLSTREVFRGPYNEDARILGSHRRKPFFVLGNM